MYQYRALLAFFALIAVCAAPVRAQGDHTHLALYAGVAIPTGDFGDKTPYPFPNFPLEFPSGYAELGFGGAVEVNMPLGMEGLFWSSSVSAYTNSVDEDFFEPGTPYDISSWINVPLMTGLQYRHWLTGALKLLLGFKLGLNIVIPPDGEETTGSSRTKYTSEMTSTFCFGIGAGMVVSDRLIILIQYLGLGEAVYDAEYREYAALGPATVNNITKPISMITISAGVAL